MKKKTPRREIPVPIRLTPEVKNRVTETAYIHILQYIRIYLPVHASETLHNVPTYVHTTVAKGQTNSATCFLGSSYVILHMYERIHT